MNAAQSYRLFTLAIACWAILLTPLPTVAGTPGPATVSDSALTCLASSTPVACLEGTNSSDYPAAMAGEVMQLSGLEPLGSPSLIDGGEEAYKAFLALVNAGHSVPAGQDASALFKGYVDRTFRRRVEAMYLRVWQMDLALTAMRLRQEEWVAWADYDANLEEQYRRSYPAFEQIVRWHDRRTTVNCAPWLAGALTRNAEYLAALGKWRDAQRMLFAAEDTFSAPLATGDLPGILLLNTFGRFVLAGWRDVDEPVSVMEQQLSTMRSNVTQATPAVTKSPALSALLRASLPAPRLAVLLGAVSGGRICRLFPHTVLRCLLRLPGLAAVGFPLAGPGAPFPSWTTAGEHAAEADELAAALNLPLSLAPVSAELANFMTDPDLPPGSAVLLGSGDGAEPRVAGMGARFSSIVAVDHSQLAMERIGEMAQRLARHPEGGNITSVLGNAATHKHPPGTASAVVASHLLEYLDAAARESLLKAIAGWLKPGGRLYAAVHLAAGERFESLLQYGNVAAAQGDGRVTVTISQLVPARPDATQVQHFFTPDGIRSDLRRAGITASNGFAVRVETHATSAGFVEAVIHVTRLK